MEGFDIHSHDLDITVREFLNRKSISVERVSEPPTPADLLRDLKCAGCDKLGLPNFTWCQEGHLVCGLCVKNFTPATDTCPAVICGSLPDHLCLKKLIGFENGVPRHLDHFLQDLELPCGATKYGCTFIGTRSELQEHEKFQCTYRKLRICYLPALEDDAEVPCGKMFGTYEELVSHMTAHGFTFKHNQKTVLQIVVKDACDATDEWVVTERRLVDYPKDRFCLLTVSENKTFVRIWLREIDPQRDAKTLPLYYLSIFGESTNLLNSYRRKILPFSLTDLTKAEDEVNACDISKIFLRYTAEDWQNGNISLTVKFLDSPTSEPFIKTYRKIAAAPEQKRSHQQNGAQPKDATEDKRSHHHHGAQPKDILKFNGSPKDQDVETKSEHTTDAPYGPSNPRDTSRDEQYRQSQLARGRERGRGMIRVRGGRPRVPRSRYGRDQNQNDDS